MYAGPRCPRPRRGGARGRSFFRRRGMRRRIGTRSLRRRIDGEGRRRRAVAEETAFSLLRRSTTTTKTTKTTKGRWRRGGEVFPGEEERRRGGMIRSLPCEGIKFGVEGGGGGWTRATLGRRSGFSLGSRFWDDFGMKGCYLYIERTKKFRPVIFVGRVCSDGQFSLSPTAGYILGGDCWRQKRKENMIPCDVLRLSYSKK